MHVCMCVRRREGEHLPLEDLSKVPLADPLLLGVKPLRVCLSLSNRGGELGGGQEGMASLKGKLHNTGNSC